MGRARALAMGLALLFAAGILADPVRADETQAPAVHGEAIAVHRLAPRDETARSSLLAPIVAASLSMATVAAGAGLLIDAKVRFPELAQRCDGAGCVPGDVTPLEQRVHAGYVLTAVGAAGAVLSVLDLVVTIRKASRPASVPRVLLSPGPGGLVVAGRF